MNQIRHVQFVQQMILVAIANFSVGISNFIIMPILTKSLSIADYGIWSQISVTINLIPAIALLGLPMSMVRFMPAKKDKDDIYKDFYSIAAIILLSSIAAVLLLSLFSHFIAKALLDNNLIIAKILLVIIFFECLNTFLLNYFRSLSKIKIYSISLIGKTFISLISATYFVLSGHGIVGAVIGLLIGSIIVFILMSCIIFSEQFFIIPDFKNVGDYLRFGLPTIPGNLSHWAVNMSDRYIIGILLGSTCVGYYSPGYVLGSLIHFFIVPFTMILPMVTARCYEEDNIYMLDEILTNSLKYFLAIAIPSALGLSLLSKPILAILSTPDIASKGHIITPFIALSYLLLGVYVIFVQIIFLEKRTRISSIIWIAASILNISLNIILMPIYGYMIGGLTTLIAFSFALVSTIYFTSQNYKLSIDGQFLFKVLLASCSMSIIAINWSPNGIWELLTEIAVCCTIYFLILFITKAIRVEDINSIKQLIIVAITRHG